MKTVICIFAVIGFIVFALIIWGAVENWLTERSDRKARKTYKAEGQRVADRLDIAHWFSNYPDAYNALTLMHFQLSTRGAVNVDAIRDFVKECGGKTFDKVPHTVTNKYFK